MGEAGLSDNNKSIAIMDKIIVSDVITSNDENICKLNDNPDLIDEKTVIDINKPLSSSCKICGLHAIKKRSGRSVLSCFECNQLVHFQCTKLPPYMLFNLSTTSKRFICEICAETPVDSLKNLINDDIKDIGSLTGDTNPVIYDKVQVVNERLETRVNNLCEIVEKYDLPKIADKIQIVYENIGKLNNDFKENITLLSKSKSQFEKDIKDLKEINVNEKNNGDLRFKEQLEDKEKEIKSLKSAETLLRESLQGNEKTINGLKNDKDINLNCINGLNHDNQVLRSQLDKAVSYKTEKENTENEVTILKNENFILNRTVSELQCKCSERENELDKQCQLQQCEIRSKQDLISSLNETNKSLQENLNEALQKRYISPLQSSEIQRRHSVNPTLYYSMTLYAELLMSP